MRDAHLRVLKHADAKRKQRLFFSDGLLESIAEVFQREAAGDGNRRAEAIATTPLVVEVKPEDENSFTFDMKN